MQYRQYGKDGPNISRLGFGVMRLPTLKEYKEVDFEQSTPLMQAAMEKGVNFFDSHHRYHSGNSEVAIGKALEGWKGDKICIQTKTPWYSEEPTEFFEKLLYEALEKLGVDRIDYLLHHSMRMPVWKERGKKFIQFTDWAINRGLIEKRGFSSHETPENIKEFIDTGEFACMLVSYNWMNPQVRDVIAYAADRGMGVSVMNPVGGGTLAANTKPILDLLPGAKSGAEIAVRYVLATPGVTATLSGMNAAGQLEENLAVAGMDNTLTPEEEVQFHTRMKEIKTQQEKFCSGCGYCMPCEHGVDIPTSFRLMNQAKFFDLTDDAKNRYKRLKNHKEGDRSAEACQRCGECEPKCPIDVPIMDQLEEVARTLGEQT